MTLDTVYTTIEHQVISSLNLTKEFMGTRPTMSLWAFTPTKPCHRSAVYIYIYKYRGKGPRTSLLLTGNNGFTRDTSPYSLLLCLDYGRW